MNLNVHTTQPTFPRQLAYLADHLARFPQLNAGIYSITERPNGRGLNAGLLLRLWDDPHTPQLLAMWAASFDSWESHGYNPPSGATGHITAQLGDNLLEIVGTVPADHLGEQGRQSYHRWTPLGHTTTPVETRIPTALPFPDAADLTREVTGLSVPTVDPDTATWATPTEDTGLFTPQQETTP